MAINDVQFIPARSTTRDQQICEVWINGRMMATITPSDVFGIRVMSRYTQYTRETPIVDGIKMSTIEFKPT